MKNNILSLAVVALILGSCDKPSSTKTAETDVAVVEENAIRGVLTMEDQANMSPDEIIGALKKGNQNFVANNLTQRDHSAQRREATMGQYPKAMVLSCVDSRVPVEDVFDLGIGDIFVARIAGNFENKDIVGSMEFAGAVAGSKLIVVMGHTTCGAVKHAIDKTDASGMGLAALGSLLKEIEPAMERVDATGHEISSKDAAFTSKVVQANVEKTVEDIRTGSPQLAKMETDGKLKIVGAVYDMESGKVTFL